MSLLPWPVGLAPAVWDALGARDSQRGGRQENKGCSDSGHRSFSASLAFGREGDTQLRVRTSVIGVDSRRRSLGELLLPQLLYHSWCPGPRDGTERRATRVDDLAFSRTDPGGAASLREGLEGPFCPQTRASSTLPLGSWGSISHVLSHSIPPSENGPPCPLSCTGSVLVALGMQSGTVTHELCSCLFHEHSRGPTLEVAKAVSAERSCERGWGGSRFSGAFGEASEEEPFGSLSGGEHLAGRRLRKASLGVDHPISVTLC